MYTLKNFKTETNNKVVRFDGGEPIIYYTLTRFEQKGDKIIISFDFTSEEVYEDFDDLSFKEFYDKLNTTDSIIVKGSCTFSVDAEDILKYLDNDGCFSFGNFVGNEDKINSIEGKLYSVKLYNSNDLTEEETQKITDILYNKIKEDFKYELQSVIEYYELESV